MTGQKRVGTRALCKDEVECGYITINKMDTPTYLAIVISFGQHLKTDVLQVVSTYYSVISIAPAS